MKKHLIFFILISCTSFAQTDSIQLKEVTINDSFLKNHYKSQSQLFISDSILFKNQPSLSQVLQFESPIYIKENGLGMVSSPSFRGTTASQTAIIWNGININSSINGQTDFSTINAKSYDALIIKPGGGSIAYGTGAIGGSVHLLDEFKYGKQNSHQINAGYGSYNSYHLGYQFRYSKNNITTSIGYNRFQSNNDYKIDNYLEKNRNGKYYFNTIDANFGAKFKQNELRLYTQFNFGKRHFSLTDLYEMPTYYNNQDYRIMGQWLMNKNRWKSDLKLAYTYEGNQYFPNKKSSNSQDLEVNNWIAKYLLSYQISTKQQLSFLVENSYSKGDGTNIKKSDRNNFGLGLIYKHSVNKQLDYEASIRQDYSSVYKVPFTYALGINYKPTDVYQLRFNLSRNYRIPTFNDLFWQTGGNPDLKAEKAFQLELGNDFKYKQLAIQTNLFYNDIKDMIQWIPSNASSLWVPVNNAHVKTYGAEFIGNYTWNHFNFRAIYSYTEAINQDTDQTLIYVPKNKVNLNVNYTLKNWNFYLQNRWVDQVYVQTDNQKTIPSYWTSNLGLGYQINSKINTIFTINNLFNHQYQSVENRFMPGINYNLSIQIKL